ncbi:hypothetical protein PGT21_036717 [Puccinia graminis f. sp. tritici]|uniref:Uncharacterized protein n=1 Tax=Puccinia graminis f. sp. tritici TaxID=56615 RepID=A0A5B0QDM5_PUCGR|nr:hypothetical protein PGT21_036717 [Puccinia graminis f. sp. tritici]KAA1138832.1 hypothetical protein PGTUg99_018432 [Puccinia graminis f. sp. tritici]
MVKGYPSRIPVIRWRIPASANGYPPTGADGPFSAKGRRVSRYPKGYPRPEGEMADPSSHRGTSTSPAGRRPFQPSRYKYLASWKETLPAGPLEGGYPRIPAAADGYTPAGADAQMAGKSSRISASARLSGCQSTISRNFQGTILIMSLHKLKTSKEKKHHKKINVGCLQEPSPCKPFMITRLVYCRNTIFGYQAGGCTVLCGLVGV